MIDVKQVTVIPATLIDLSDESSANSAQKRKVAAYARVSTELEQQQSSYTAQVSYYINYIQSRDDWEFVRVYADEGISGLNTKRREAFKEMVADALAGKIDLIITKSVSRFARNTVDSLTTIRNLKEHGVECYFEKENIWTFDSKGELLLTIMSSIAQEESRSISENTRWGKRKSMQDGKVTVPFSTFLGYDRGPHGELVVNQEQAVIVRKIFTMFLQGFNCRQIAETFTSDGILTVTGKTKWRSDGIMGILKNEKYKGDALLQKTYTSDFLTKKVRINRGEIPQYYVKDDHEAIIEPEVFDFVQKILSINGRRRNTSSASVLSGKIYCGYCGGCYGRKVWHSNDKYRRLVWRCNQKYKSGKDKCTTPHLTETQVKELFVKAVNELLRRREDVISSYDVIIENDLSTESLQKQADAIETEISGLVDKNEMLIGQNAAIPIDQKLYREQRDKIMKRYEELTQEHQRLIAEISKREVRREMIRYFLPVFENLETVREFDDKLWISLLDHMTAYSKEKIVFQFKDGSEIVISIAG